MAKKDPPAPSASKTPPGSAARWLLGMAIMLEAAWMIALGVLAAMAMKGR